MYENNDFFGEKNVVNIIFKLFILNFKHNWKIVINEWMIFNILSVAFYHHKIHIMHPKNPFGKLISPVSFRLLFPLAMNANIGAKFLVTGRNEFSI